MTDTVIKWSAELTNFAFYRALTGPLMPIPAKTAQSLAPHAILQGNSLSLLRAMLTSGQTPLGTRTNISVLGAIWVVVLATALRVTACRKDVLEQ